jgi:hypothetical protein
MGLLHAFGQSDLGLNDTPTAGYNLLRMEVSNRRYWRYSPWGPTEVTTGLTGDNLLDVDVRNSVQFHKDEILLPGRSIKFFMNAKFGGAPPPNRPGIGYDKAPFGLPPIFKAPVVTAWSWAGPYIGANIGYSFGRSKTDPGRHRGRRRRCRRGRQPDRNPCRSADRRRQRRPHQHHVLQPDDQAGLDRGRRRRGPSRRQLDRQG